MCLILFAWRMHKDYPLVIAANRDEFHARPTERLAFWQNRPDVLAGRDIEAGGTWMGITRSGRFAALTNYRELADRDRAGRSRGLLVSECLTDEAPAEASVTRATAEGEAYRGFNLLAADREALWWTSNRGAGPLRLAPGLYGLSNHLLETPWPKVVRGRSDSAMRSPARRTRKCCSPCSPIPAWRANTNCRTPVWTAHANACFRQRASCRPPTARARPRPS